MENIAVSSLPREGGRNKLENVLSALDLLFLHYLLLLIHKFCVLVTLRRRVQTDGGSLSLLPLQESHQPEMTSWLIPSVRIRCGVEIM